MKHSRAMHKGVSDLDCLLMHLPLHGAICGLLLAMTRDASAMAMAATASLVKTSPARRWALVEVKGAP
jgi:hypothetical protein